MNQALLKAINIAKSFDYELFCNVTLELFPQDSIAIMGRSGSGKSTLLHILSTLLKADKGRVYLFGKDIYTLKERELELIRRKKIGIIFQSHYLFKGMSALDNIEAATLLAETSIDMELIKLLEIDHLLNKKVSKLSGGQQQRVSIARVLSKRPKIIFADEPTGNLDKNTANLVMDALNEYIKRVNGALFLVTHDLDIAKKTQKIYLLEDKKLFLY